MPANRRLVYFCIAGESSVQILIREHVSGTMTIPKVKRMEGNISECCGIDRDRGRHQSGIQSDDEAGRIFSSMRATAIESGPSIEQPLAHSCPPPPKSSAISATLSLPLLRKLTR
jgi:hypothetical protein